MDAATIFAEVLNKPDDSSRAKFLDEVCGQNADLRTEVNELLQAHGAAGDFLCIGETAALAETCQQSSSISEKAGDQIGPYKLLQQIGEGGFGVVYMAEQTEPVRRKVALKVIKPGMDTKEVIARFEAERQALALMDHPNIARVLDGGTTQTGRPFFVMELVKGIPITQFCDENKLKIHQRLRLFCAVCRAIQHAHQKGVIHRDIKPSNVLVTLHDGEPVPRIIDFGVAKAISQQLTEKTMFTAFGQMIGTPQYMSPEQAEMSGLDVDTRSDIFSLGVLLYELLTGSTPLDPKMLHQTAYQEMQRLICEEEPPRPSMRLTKQREQSVTIATRRNTVPEKLGAYVRGDLDWIVMQALDKNRERRYDSANAFAADIDRFLTNLPVEACPPTTLYRLRKFGQRNRPAFLTASAITASLLIGLSFAVWQAVTASQQRDLAAIAKREAIQEAERAEAILSFLNESVFSEAIPYKLAERDISLRTILQQIPTEDDTWSDRPPLAEASIRHYLGMTCNDVALTVEGKMHLERALALRRLHLGDNHVDTARTKFRLVAMQVGRHTMPDLASVAAEAFETLTTQLGKDHVDSLQAASVLALTRHFLGQQDEAMRIYQEIRQLLPGDAGRDPHDPFDLRHSVGVLIRREQAGRSSEVDQIIEANYAEVCRNLPEHHIHRLMWTSWRGIMLMRQGRLPEADALLTDAYEKRVKIFHLENKFVFLGTRTLAGLRVRQNRFDEAIALLRLSREARPDAASISLGLGLLLLQRGEPGDRSEWHKLAIAAVDRREEDVEHPWIAERVVCLALAVPPETDSERQMQQRAIHYARRAAVWADREPPAHLMFPKFMRSGNLLASAMAEYRDGEIDDSLALFEQVEQERSWMCRAVAYAYHAAIERSRGNEARGQELIASSKHAAASAPSEELDDAGQHLWNRRFRFEQALREAEDSSPTQG